MPRRISTKREVIHESDMIASILGLIEHLRTNMGYEQSVAIRMAFAIHGAREIN